MLREDESGTGGGKESSFNGKSSYFRNLNVLFGGAMFVCLGLNLNNYAV